MNTKRTELYRELPLSTPYSIHIFPSFYCNFKCNYCLHSLSKEQLKDMNFQKQFMDFDIFKKAIDGAMDFPGKIKALIFAGHGEPLLHKEIAEMVAYAKQTGKFERIEIVTNGSLLRPELSDQLIQAGLDRLRISLQGIDERKYKDVSAVDIDFPRFLENIRYFYEKKKSTEVYIKIIDVALDQKEDEKKFKALFQPVADVVAVEYAIPFVNEIDYESVGQLSDKCKQGHKKVSQICSMPFYMMVVNPNGDMVPCCATEIPIVFGSIKNETMAEIWQSEKRKQFLRSQLGGAGNINVCRECSVPEFGLQEGDYLDGHEKELWERYQ